MANELDESLLHSVAERHVGKCQETERPEAYKLGEPSSVMIPFSTHSSFQSAIYPQGKYYLPAPSLFLCSFTDSRIVSFHWDNLHFTLTMDNPNRLVVGLDHGTSKTGK